MSLIVVEIATPHGTEWVLTEDPDAVRASLSDWQGKEIALHDPEEIIASQFNGWAALSSCL